MKAYLLIPAILSLSLSAFSPAQPSHDVPDVRLTSAEVRHLMHEANDLDQNHSLAVYFRQQQKAYSAKAAEEKLTWDARAQNPVGSGKKYPRPVDSAHYLYDSYTYDADRSGKLAEHYELLAQSPTASANP